MSPLDVLFSRRGETYQHPLLRFLDSARPGNVRVEVVRPRDVLGYKPASLYFHWAAGGVDQPPQPYAWDAELNAELVRRGIRSVSPDAEKVRFGLALRDAFRRPEARFGDGFFNAVLIVVVEELEFPAYPEVAEVLRHVTRNRPHAGGNSYADCRLMIEGVIRDRAKELVDFLKYPEPEAKDVLAGAVARYLDDRFSVTNRIRLGWAGS